MSISLALGTFLIVIGLLIIAAVVAVLKDTYFQGEERWREQLNYLLNDPIREGSREWNRIKGEEINRLRRLGKRRGYTLEK